MKKSSGLVSLGRVHGCSTNHDVREFTVSIYNSVDMLPHTQGEFNDEDTSGYKEAEALEELLENIRNNLCICYHGAGIDLIVKNEDV